MSSPARVWLRWLRRVLGRTHWAARWLGFEVPKGRAEKPGLILLQIDGLSRRQFDDAMAKGRLPFLARLIRKGMVSSGSFYSGVPSTTPAVQAEIFYRERCAVPSFQFMRRRDGHIFRMYEAESAAGIESELAARSPRPLLEDGHSYSNIYRAGAMASWYCSQDLDLGLMMKRMHVLKGIVLVAAYAVRFLRMIGLALLELMIAVTDMFGGLFERKNFLRELLFVPTRIGICILVREMIRFKVLLDIERGIRVIHANFLGYDEQAHRRGPDSAFAHWTLKGIDRAVRDIHRAAVRSHYRHYEVIVYSDHGQERVVPFPLKTGRSIEEAVEAVVARGPLEGREVFIPRIPEFVGGTLARCRGFFGIKTPVPGAVATAGDLREKIVVTALGPVGHVYLPVPLERRRLEELAAALVEEGGVPMVLLRGTESGMPVTAFNRRGRWTLPADGREILGKGHPFPDETAEDLARLARHPDAGDFILSGWDREDPPVSFPMENGAHGGPGPEETHGFILLPTGHDLRVGQRIRGSDLHGIANRLLARDDGSPETRNLMSA